MEKKKKQDELILEAKNFFDANKKELGNSFRKGEGVICLSFQQIAEFSPLLSESILETPEQVIALMENALEESGLVKRPRIRFIEYQKLAI